MIQKIMISQDGSTEQLTIREFAVVDWRPKQKDSASLGSEDFSLLHEETYAGALIKTAISEGRQTLISELRTHNFYPIGMHADTIADSVISLYQSGKNMPVELVFNDQEQLQQDKEEIVLPLVGEP